MNINKKRLIVLFSINVFIIVHILLWYKYGFQKVGTFSMNGIVTLLGFGLLNSAAAFFYYYCINNSVFWKGILWMGMPLCFFPGICFTGA